MYEWDELDGLGELNELDYLGELGGECNILRYLIGL